MRWPSRGLLRRTALWSTIRFFSISRLTPRQECRDNILQWRIRNPCLVPFLSRTTRQSLQRTNDLLKRREVRQHNSPRPLRIKTPVDHTCINNADQLITEHPPQSNDLTLSIALGTDLGNSPISIREIQLLKLLTQNPPPHGPPQILVALNLAHEPTMK